MQRTTMPRSATPEPEHTTVVPCGEYFALHVGDDTASPLFHAGDVLLVRRDGPLGVDGCIAVQRPGQPVKLYALRAATGKTATVRRILWTRGERWTTVPRRYVLGRVILRWCRHDAEWRIVSPDVA